MNERQISFSPSITQNIKFNKIKFQYASIFVGSRKQQRMIFVQFSLEILNILLQQT